jgi:hypothetical protein
MLKRTAWIWAVGCAVWCIDGGISVYQHAAPHAELDFLMAILFAIAWLFYRDQQR